MRIRQIARIVAASVVIIAAASASTKTPVRGFRSHLIGPASASHVKEDNTFYTPPRSPGYNDLTAS